MAIMLTVGLRIWADAISGWVFAVLGVAAILAIGFGLLHAWRVRLSPLVVIPDVELDEGIPAEAVAGLSVQLRDTVRRALHWQSDDARRAEMRTLQEDIAAGLVTVHGATTLKTNVAELNRTTLDSMSTLSASMRAVAPKEVEGIAAALELAIPAQRGWIVRASPTIRGTDDDVRVGLCLEVAALGHGPEAVTTFWTTSSDLQKPLSDTARLIAIRELLHELVRPASVWIAIRLVSRHLTQTHRWFSGSLPIHRGRRRELTGLQLQLGGQLLLYATRRQRKFAGGFAYEALDDLKRAAKLLPHYYRPHLTQAAVYERLGWSYRQSGDDHRARSTFTRAVESYDKAEKLLHDCKTAEKNRQKAANERLALRRTKCRLLSCNSRYVGNALRELGTYSHLADTSPESLYNAACLFAVATACPSISGTQRIDYERRAWDLLGHSLFLSSRDNGLWSRMMSDEELDTLDATRRKAFGEQIKQRSADYAELGSRDADLLVKSAMAALGMM